MYSFWMYLMGTRLNTYTSGYRKPTDTDLYLLTCNVSPLSGSEACYLKYIDYKEKCVQDCSHSSRENFIQWIFYKGTATIRTQSTKVLVRSRTLPENNVLTLATTELFYLV